MDELEMILAGGKKSPEEYSKCMKEVYLGAIEMSIRNGGLTLDTVAYSCNTPLELKIRLDNALKEQTNIAKKVRNTPYSKIISILKESSPSVFVDIVHQRMKEIIKAEKLEQSKDEEEEDFVTDDGSTWSLPQEYTTEGNFLENTFELPLYNPPMNEEEEEEEDFVTDDVDLGYDPSEFIKMQEKFMAEKEKKASELAVVDASSE